MPAAMTMPATSVISTARSPTTWQPNILWLLRSIISLQKPTLCPSMIVRVVESKRKTAVSTSCPSRDFASVRPTWAYSGVRETADGTHRVPNRHRRALHGVSSRNEAVPYRLRDQHQAAGNVSSGKDMGLRGPQILINLDESPMIGLDAGCSEAQPSSIGRPPYRHKCQCRLSAALDAVPGEDHSHPRWCFFECLDDTDILVDRDVRAAESRRNCCGYILILTRQDARPCLEELDARAKGVEDRGDLHPCCSSANDQHRWRDGGQSPCVAMVIRQFRAAH